MTEGTIAHHDARVTCRYKRSLRHPVDVAWKAITDPDEVERWTGNRPEIDLRPGGNYISHHRGGQRVVDRITRMEQPRCWNTRSGSTSIPRPASPGNSVRSATGAGWC